MKDSDAQEELEEVQSELKKREDQVSKQTLDLAFLCYATHYFFTILVSTSLSY